MSRDYPNPRWPPDAIVEINILTIYHRMLYNMSFKVFSSIQNPILMLFLSFKAGPVSAVGSPSSQLAFGNSQVQLPGRHILSQVVSYF